MSDFIQDMKDATEIFKKWADTNAILDDDFRTIDTLLQKHYDQRDELFEVMLKILEQSGDSLADDWQRVCDKGLDILDRLNSAIPSRAADGLRGIGLGSFYEGEKKIWQENRKAKIATLAEVISEIGKNDDDLIKALEEDLKKAREDGRAADELVRATFGETREAMRQLVTQAAEKGATKVVSEIPLIGEKVAPVANKAVETLLGGSEKTRDLAKKKRAYKDILINNRKKIDELQDKLNDKCIETALKEGVETAYSLRDGATGDFKAADWTQFGSECAKRLNVRSDPAIDRARYLYQTVRPAYIEGLTGAFATLASDQESLAKFRSQLDEDTQEVYEALRRDEDVVRALRDGSTKTSAYATLMKIKNDVTEAVKNLNDKIKENEELMNPGSF